MLVNVFELESALKQLKNFTSKKDYRPVLQGIHVMYDGDTLTLEACDSYIANIIKLNVIDRKEYDTDVDMVIDPIDFKAPKNAYVETVEINFNDMYIAYPDGRRISINRVLEDRYPSLESIVPNKEVKAEFTLNVDYLKSVIKGLNKGDTVTFNVFNEVTPLILSSKNNEIFKENTMVISPCKRY